MLVAGYVQLISRAAGRAAGRQMTMDDPCDLNRLVAARDPGGTCDRAIAELRSGRILRPCSGDGPP